MQRPTSKAVFMAFGHSADDWLTRQTTLPGFEFQNWMVAALAPVPIVALIGVSEKVERGETLGAVMEIGSHEAAEPMWP